jgi:hypothetical protein
MGEKQCIQNFGLKSAGFKLLGILRHIWEDNIKTDRKEMMQEVGIHGGQL